jgi:hypothetical protein
MTPNNSWTDDELQRFGDADEIHLASVRRDGSLRRPVTMWMVTDDGDLYVRAVKGVNGPWYRYLRGTDLAHVAAGGVDADVRAQDASTDPDLADRLDAAYQEKYARYPAAPVRSVLNELARGSSLRLIPRR